MSQTHPTYPAADATDPYPFYEYLHRQGPVYLEPGTNRYFVSTRASVMQVLRDPVTFSNVDKNLGDKPQVPPRAMIMLDPPDSKKARRLGSLAVTPGRIRRYETMIRAEVEERIDEFIDRGRVELFSEFAAPFSASAACKLLGLPTGEDMRALYTRAAALSVGSGISFLPDDRKASVYENWKFMGGFIGSTIADRAENPRDDALTEMIAAQREQDGVEDLAYVQEQALAVFLAGITTVAHMMTNTMTMLVQNPDQLALVTADPTLILKMIEESIRLQSPAQWVPRRVTQETEVEGVAIPAGSFVLCMLAAANRGDDVFEHPEAFDISRENAGDHVGFGYGTHFCLGAPLARLEGRVAFEGLFARLQNIRASEGLNDFKVLPSPIFRAYEAIWIDFDRAR